MVRWDGNIVVASNHAVIFFLGENKIKNTDDRNYEIMCEERFKHLW